MKKHILIIGFLCLFFFTKSQTVIYENLIDNPDGWYIGQNWHFQDGQVYFSWEPAAFNFTAQTHTVEFFVPENTVLLRVKHYLDVFSGSSDELSQISIQNNIKDSVLWHHPLAEGSFGSISGDISEFNIQSFAGTNCKLVFSCSGSSSYYWSLWSIYEFSLITYFNQDLSIKEISGSKILEKNQNGTWQAKVENLGFENVSHFTLRFYNYLNGETLSSQFYNHTIEPGENYAVSQSWSVDSVQNMIIKAEVTYSGDEYNGNNHSKGLFLRIDPDFDYQIFVWDADNNIASLQDPEKNNSVEGHQSITIPLNYAGIPYELSQVLPDNLSYYDIIFVPLGAYCLS